MQTCLWNARSARGADEASAPTQTLHQALVEHRVGYFQEAADVGAIH